MTSPSNAKDEEPLSFDKYWSAVDAALTELYGIDTCDAGIEPNLLAAFQDDNFTPEEFALWFGEKYGLTPSREWKAMWGRL